MPGIFLEYGDRYTTQELNRLRRDIASKTHAIISYTTDTRLLEEKLKQFEDNLKSTTDNISGS